MRKEADRLLKRFHGPLGGIDRTGVVGAHDDPSAAHILDPVHEIPDGFPSHPLPFYGHVDLKPTRRLECELETPNVAGILEFIGPLDKRRVLCRPPGLPPQFRQPLGNLDEWAALDWIVGREVCRDNGQRRG